MCVCVYVYDCMSECVYGCVHVSVCVVVLVYILMCVFVWVGICICICWSERVYVLDLSPSLTVSAYKLIIRVAVDVIAHGCQKYVLDRKIH